MADREYLPGLPPPKLVRGVRRHLRAYVITPMVAARWRLAWVWSHSDRMSDFDPRWPMPCEIGAQYLVHRFLPGCQENAT
jgi:hypothetical protein